MPIDPKKLRAFGGGGGPEPEQPDGDDDEVREGGGGRYSQLIPLLEEHASEIEDAALDLEVNPQDVLHGEDYEPDPGVLEVLHAGYDDLEDDLREGLAPLAGASPQECEELAQHLEAEGMVGSPDEVAAWLCLVAEEVLGGAEEEGDEEEGDGEGDEEGGGESYDEGG